MKNIPLILNIGKEEFFDCSIPMDILYQENDPYWCCCEFSLKNIIKTSPEILSFKTKGNLVEISFSSEKDLSESFRKFCKQKMEKSIASS